jgi:hypothetical protein
MSDFIEDIIHMSRYFEFCIGLLYSIFSAGPVNDTYIVHVVILLTQLYVTTVAISPMVISCPGCRHLG